MAHAQVATEAVLEHSGCAVAVEFLEQLATRDEESRHLFVAGFVNGLVREIVMRDRAVHVLRSRLAGRSEGCDPH